MSIHVSTNIQSIDVLSINVLSITEELCKTEQRPDPVGMQLVDPLENLLDKSHRLHWPANVSKSKTNQQRRGF